MALTLAAIAGAWLRVKPDAGADELAAAEEAVVTAAVSDEVPAQPVRVDTVRQASLELRVTATGQTEAVRRATVAATDAGRLVAVLVGEGERVRGAQVIARLDPREALSGVRQAEAGVAEAEARYREMTLFDDRIDDPAVREARARAARARSGLDAAEAALARARLELDDTALTAPISGRVTDVRAGPGEVVAAGQALLTVVDPAPILIEVRVVESELRWLREDGAAEVRLAALPDTVFQGRIRSVSPVVDPETRTARVTVLADDADGRILPGMFAEVSLEGRSFAERILVPEEAVLERDDRTLVFVFEPLPNGPPGEGRARWVYVTTGLSNGRQVELVAGEGTELPRPGTPVITGGNYTLVHEAPVRIAEGP